MSGESSPRQVDPRVMSRIVLAANAIYALVLWQAWGDRWAVGGLAAIHVAHLLVVAFVHPWSKRRPARCLAALAAAHGVLNILAGHVAHWSLAAWFLTPFHVVAGIGYQDRESRAEVGVFLAVNGTVAALDGVPAFTILAFSAMTVALYGVWESRNRILRETLSLLRSERSKLDAAQRTLVAQEKMSSLGVLAAGIAHEINNPMSYVTSNVYALIEDLPRLASEQGLFREYADDVLPATLDGIERVNAVVADLRRFARGESKAMERFDLNAEVEAALRISHNELRHRCRTEVKLGALPPIVGRPREIARVVLNLLVNAAQAMTTVGLLRVTTCARDGGVVLTVEDDGSGMPPETLARAFEPFFTTKPVGEGTGLGLAVAHGIVKAHGGRIELASALGDGTTVTVWLPHLPPTPHPHPPGRAREGAASLPDRPPGG